MPNKNKWNHIIQCFGKTPEEAINYLQSKGIKITWDWKEQLEAIKEHAFTVSKITSADILELVHENLVSAIKEGKTKTEFIDEIKPQLQSQGFATKEDGSNWRLDTIFRTNLQSAFMAGRFKQMTEVKNEFPYWELLVVQDDRTTDGCRDLAGTTLHADDTFWDTNYPPRHYNCRDRVRALNDALLKKYNIKISDSAKLKNVQPAQEFAHSPVESWKPDLSKYNAELQNVIQELI